MKQFEVYLAGRISGLNYDEAQHLRLKITEKLTRCGIKVRNPMRGKVRFLKSKGKITVDVVRQSEEAGAADSVTLQELILRDLHDLDRVNALVVITGDEPSWGTCGEFWYTTWVSKKPTLVISKNGDSISWLSHFATKIVKNEDEAVEVLKVWQRYWDDGEGVYDIE